MNETDAHEARRTQLLERTSDFERLDLEIVLLGQLRVAKYVYIYKHQTERTRRSTNLFRLVGDGQRVARTTVEHALHFACWNYTTQLVTKQRNPTKHTLLRTHTHVHTLDLLVTSAGSLSNADSKDSICFDISCR